MAAYKEVSSLPDAIVQALRGHRVTRSLRRSSRVYTDTTDFTSLDYGDIIQVEGRYFLITSYTKEGRFGVDDQIKCLSINSHDLVQDNHSGRQCVEGNVREIRFLVPWDQFAKPVEP